MALPASGKGGAAESKPLRAASDDRPDSLANKIARVEMKRANARESLPASAIRKLESRKGAR